MRSFKIRFRLDDLLFFLLLVFSFYYNRNILCRLMMVVFFGYTVFQMITRKSKMPVPFFYIGLLVFILYGAANITLDNVIDAGVARTMVKALVLNFIMTYSIVQYIYMTNDIPRILRITEHGFFTTAFVVVLLSLGTITQGRLGGGTEMNSNALAILCVYGFVLSMYLRKNNMLTTGVYWFRVAFYMLAVLLTGSRKGVIMIVLAIVVVQVALERRKIFKNILIGVGVATGFYILIMNVKFLYNIIGVRVENLINLLTDGSTRDGSLLSRQTLIEIGLKYIKEKPWTGYGYDCFKLISGVNGTGNVGAGEAGYYSHNNYIELLVGGGIIGFVLYYIPIAYLLGRLLKGNRYNVCMPYLLAILVSKLSIEYAFVSCFGRTDSYILAIILGCVIIAQKTKDNKVNYAKERM